MIEDGNRLLVTIVLPDLEATQERIGVLSDSHEVGDLVRMLGDLLGIASPQAHHVGKKSALKNVDHLPDQLSPGLVARLLR